ncbi:hypothetical protein BU26DRAFT_570503 [Trematosphaeria pertusa]|uniref:Uncharacterized protein n=1 Tax=Trematosphaeria pertusa TaxID=390896 RepID=A0A6A6I0K0_9PLEO|nr:uncharacterized protein BU26DRAFT_570503 [Trematosphaeria pertusa]KAF2243100.1 hypothetical protein BU26DRAFT_570503 [Trematosphaeria pertusa]
MVYRVHSAISKAAAIRRRNHQIPRKRPTKFPPHKPTSRGVARPVSPPTPKNRPVPSPETRKKEPKPSKSSTPARGENRTTLPGVDTANLNAWPVRRILASRKKPGDPSSTEYKVQWDSSWEEASTLRGTALQEWKDAAEKEDTFEYVAQDGGKWEVLKDEHWLENDSEDSQWEMWMAIWRNAIEEGEKNWFATLKENDFAFADEAEEKKAAYLAGKCGLDRPGSAMEVLAAAWKDGKENSLRLRNDRIVYADIKVRFVGQLDPWYDDDDIETASHDPTPKPHPALTVAHVIRSLHTNAYSQLRSDAFSRNHGTYANCTHWRAVTKNLIHTAPFMFRSGTWTQLLALLLLGGKTLKAELEAVGVRVKEDWSFRAREYCMHMYYERIVDDRPIHDIQETFLCLREFFRELGPDEEEKRGETAAQDMDEREGKNGGTAGLDIGEIDSFDITQVPASDYASCRPRKFDSRLCLDEIDDKAGAPKRTPSGRSEPVIYASTSNSRNGINPALSPASERSDLFVPDTNSDASTTDPTSLSSLEEVDDQDIDGPIHAHVGGRGERGRSYTHNTSKPKAVQDEKEALEARLAAIYMREASERIAEMVQQETVRNSAKRAYGSMDLACSQEREKKGRFE